MGVTVGGDDLEHTVVNGQDGHIEGTTAQIEHQDVLLTTLLVQTVGDGSGSGLVNDTDHVQTRNGTRVLGCLTLGIVEVGRDSDHGMLDGLAQVGLSGLLHLLQNHGGDLLRRENLGLTIHINLDIRLGVLVDDLVGHQLGIALDLLVREPAEQRGEFQ